MEAHAQSKEEYGETLTGGARSSVTLAGRALVERVFQSREEHPEPDPLPLHREDAALEGRQDWLPVPKKRRTLSSARRFTLASLPKQQPTRKGKAKAKTAKNPPVASGSSEKFRSRWTVPRSSPGADGVTFSIALFLLRTGGDSPSTLRNRPSTLFPNCSLVSVGSRHLMVGHGLGVAEV